MERWALKEAAKTHLLLLSALGSRSSMTSLFFWRSEWASWSFSLQHTKSVCVHFMLWSHVFKLNVRSSRILTNAPQAFSSVRRTLKKKKKKHKKLITVKTNTQGFLNGTHTHAHTHIYISCESQAVKELNHGPAGQRVGRTYDGLILAGLIDGGRQRETDREGQALTVNHHKHGLNSHTACTNVEQTLQSSVLQSQGSIWSVCHANTLLLHMGTLLTQF